jgi:HlyD family secretion protein
LSAVTTVQVGTQVSGTVSKLYVDFNSVVREGQVIATIDTTFLYASVLDAQAALKRAQALANQAKRDLDRTKPLVEKKLAAQVDLDNITSTVEQTAAGLESAKAQLQRAMINLHYATIKAPISGVVIGRAVDVGQTVAASFSTPTLFTIAQDLTKMQVQANVDEADIGKLKMGQRVSFTVDAYPSRQFEGEISQIRLQPVVVQNVVNYTVIVNVPNEDKVLMPGMTANISVTIDAHEHVVKVPTSALRFSPPREVMEALRQQWAAKKDSSGGAAGDTAHRERRGPRGEGGGMAGGGGGQGGMGGGSRQQGEMLPGSRARIWVKDGTGLKMIRVTTGLSDGAFTEVDSISAGTEVITGIVADPNGAPQQQQQNPFQGMRRF